jgi:hypothetical protein
VQGIHLSLPRHGLFGVVESGRPMTLVNADSSPHPVWESRETSCHLFLKWK